MSVLLRALARRQKKIAMGDRLSELGSYELAEEKYLEAKAKAAAIYFTEGRQQAFGVLVLGFGLFIVLLFLELPRLLFQRPGLLHPRLHFRLLLIERGSEGKGRGHLFHGREAAGAGRTGCAL